MTHPFDTRPPAHPSSNSTAPAWAGLLALGLLCVPSCGPKDGAAGAGSGGAASEPASGAAKTATAPGKKEPAVAAQFINLRGFAMPEGAEKISLTAANASYRVKGEVKAIYEFQRKQFLALGWKELPDSSITDQSASGAFAGAGYRISASVYPVGEPGSVMVVLHNHGSVDLGKLPLPSGTKPVYVGALSAMHVTAAAPAETAAAVHRMLADAGWEPHGEAGDSRYFKNGLNRITVTIGPAPAQGGKTMISYLCEWMAGDLPALPGAEAVRYTDQNQELAFDAASGKDEVVSFYKGKLGKTGWKPNHEETYRIDDYDEMVFRSGNGDVIFLKIMAERGGKRPVSLSFLSADEVKELDRKTKEQGERIKAKLAAERAAAASGGPASGKPKVAVRIPVGAQGVEQTKGGFKFTVANGGAKAVAEAWRKEFRDAGWKEDAAALDPLAGMISFSKDGQDLSVNYTDTGFTPAEINISAIGVELERAGAAK